MVAQRPGTHTIHPTGFVTPWGAGPADTTVDSTHRGWMTDGVMAAVAARAAERHGVISVAEATHLGLTRGRRRAAIGRGEWLRPLANVLVAAGAPPTWRQRAAIAVTASGGVLSHRAAAHLHSLDGIPEPAIEVTVPASCSWRHDGTIVHRAQSMDRADVLEVDGIDVTSSARTLVDLGAVVDADTVEQVLDDALRRGVSPQWIAQTLDRLARPGRSGTGTLRRVLERPDRRGPLPDSVFERLVERICVAAGLPAPERQVEVRDETGRVVGRIDVGWPERRIGVEGHSRRWHSGTLRGERDRVRDNRLTALGWELLYASWSDTEHPEALMRDVRAAYDRRAP